jgi:Protein of unknown function (DUF4241)
MPTICGTGSEWDSRRGQTKFWVELDNGVGYAGYGDRLPAARLDLHRQLDEIDLPLAELGPLGVEIARDLEAWSRQISQFPGGRPAEPVFDYARAMADGAAITLDFAEGALSGTTAVEQAGILTTTSGQLYAGDPFGSRVTGAFTRTVVPGSYPVLISWAVVAGEPRRRSVIAWIQFLPAQVIRWEQALAEGQDVAWLEPGERFGCTVDSGCACFADAGVEPGEGELDVAFDEASQCGPHLVAFTSGWGDGQYACYWGFDEAGAPAVLLMDLELISSVAGGRKV